MPPRPLVILGSGYTARFLWPLIAGRTSKVFATSRSPEQHLDYVHTEQRIRFDLSQPDTWPNIPLEADFIWCFPASPIDLVRAFIESRRGSISRLVVLGSTSAYDVQGDRQYPPPWIDETAPVDLRKPRVQGEEFLRTDCTAVILRVAGIYGPGRNPLDWIRTGRVGPSRKYVNLIHVEDLAAICLAGLERGTPGEAYNVSDGHPCTWDTLCETAAQRWNIQPVQTAVIQDPGKRLSIAKLTQQLGYTIRHHDLYNELDRLLKT